MSSNTAQTTRYRNLFFFFSLNVLLLYIGHSRCLYDAIDPQKPTWRDEPQERPIQIQILKHNPQEEQTKEQQRRRRRLEFVHIPKTGGTAIESIASHANITWSICHFGIAKYMAINSNNLVQCGPNDLKHNWPKIPKFNHCPWWHVPPAYIEAFFPEHNPYAGADLFAVVRNPYDRIISEYYYHIQDVAKEKDPKANNAEHFNQKLNRQLSKFVSGMRRGDLSSRIPGNNVYFSGSGHMIPQYDFIYDDKHRRIVEHVLRFENLTENFAGLMANYDLAIRLPERKFRHSVGKELSVHNLTKENILLIEAIYWDDFREFGYEVISLRE